MSRTSPSKTRKPRADGLVTVGFQVTPADKDEITRLAAAERRTFSSYLRILVEDHLRKPTEEPATATGR